MFTWLHHNGLAKECHIIGWFHVIPCLRLKVTDNHIVWTLPDMVVPKIIHLANTVFGKRSQLYNVGTTISNRNTDSTISSMIPKVVSRWRVPCNPILWGDGSRPLREALGHVADSPWPISQGTTLKALSFALTLEVINRDEQQQQQQRQQQEETWHIYYNTNRSQKNIFLTHT